MTHWLWKSVGEYAIKLVHCFFSCFVFLCLLFWPFYGLSEGHNNWLLPLSVVNGHCFVTSYKHIHTQAFFNIAVTKILIPFEVPMDPKIYYLNEKFLFHPKDSTRSYQTIKLLIFLWLFGLLATDKPSKESSLFTDTVFYDIPC